MAVKGRYSSSKYLGIVARCAVLGDPSVLPCAQVTFVHGTEGAAPTVQSIVAPHTERHRVMVVSAL